MADQRPEHDAALHWGSYAQEWTEWARAPGHDAYWFYRDQFAAFARLWRTFREVDGYAEVQLHRKHMHRGSSVEARLVSQPLRILLFIIRETR